MKQETVNLIYELVDEVKETKEYKRLIILKKEINEQKEIELLISDFNNLKMKYEEAAKYGKYHPDLKKIQKDFSRSKEMLYNNEVVKEYKDLENVIQARLDLISRNIAQSISNKIRYPNEMGLINKH